MNKNAALPAVFLTAIGLLVAGADWPQFLGPGGAGTSDATGLPTTWSADENVVWKTPMPGFGTSSPIIVGDKIFVTCYSGYGLDKDEPGDQKNLRYHVVAVDGAKGEKIWSRDIEPKMPQTEFGGFTTLHGYASSTPASDGKAVYAFFGSTGVFAYGLDGEQLWHADVGSKTHNWSSAASPIVAGDLVIVNASIESGSLVALDKRTGDEVWRAPGIVQSWGTPVLVDSPHGQSELVVSVKEKILAYEPTTGKPLWECKGIADYICPSPIAHDGVVYATGGRKTATIAVRAGGRGAVEPLWEVKDGSKVGTPLYHDGHLYWLDDKGMAACLDASTGEQVYREKMQIKGGGDKVYASLVHADGKLITVSRQGGAVVLAAKPEFEVLARNDLGDSSVFNATPVPWNFSQDGGGRIILRSDQFLYCIAK